MKKQPNLCLNCNTELKLNFCENCGQKASTKRFSLFQLISSDFLQSFFSLEAGFLFTLKSLFTRPGHFVREYILGKRKTYFHFLTFLLIVLGISIFLGEYSQISMSDLMEMSSDKSKKIMVEVENFSKNNPRIMMLIQIPGFALMSFLWFLRSKLNFAEHLILNTYKASGEILIMSVFAIIAIFYTDIAVLKYIFYIFLYVFAMLFIIVLYYQFFAPYYKNKVLLFLRIIASIITAQLVISFFLGILIGFKIAMEGGLDKIAT